MVPRGRFARPLPRYEGGVPLSGLAGTGANPETRALFRRLQGGCITFNAWSANFGASSWNRTMRIVLTGDALRHLNLAGVVSPG